MYFHKWVKRRTSLDEVGGRGDVSTNTCAIPSCVVNNIVSLMDR